MIRDIAVLRAGWKRGGLRLRYFLATHIVANLLTFALSLASMGASAMGRAALQWPLLGVAALCAMQAWYSWHVLRHRYQLHAAP